MSESSANLARKAGYLPDVHRMLPQSPEAEQGVLSSLLLAPRPVLNLCHEKGVTPDCFHIPAHETVYRVAAELIEADRPIDFITLTDTLRSREKFDSIGGAGFLTALWTFLPTAANAGYYIDILTEKRLAREIIATCTEMAARAYSETEQATALADELQKRACILTAAGAASANKFVPLRKILVDGMQRLMERSEMRGRVSGACIGIADIDRMTDGIQDQELWLIAARPSMGKTALAFQAALHMARWNSLSKNPAHANPLPVVIFSVEMAEALLGDRLVAQITGISIKRFADGFMAKGDAFDRAINNAMAKLAEWTPNESAGQKPVKLWVDDTPAISIQQLTNKCRYAAEQLGAKVIVIDYAQLITSSSDKAKRNRLEEVSEVSRGLKAIARAFRVKLIVAAQLNRDVDERPGHVPLLSDMRECGQLEQDADVVLAPVRPGYYAKTDAQKAKLIDRIKQVPDEKGGWRDCDAEDAAKYAEVHILKQRAGCTGFAKCWYHGEQCWFDGWTKELFSNNPDKRQANAAENSGPKHGEGSDAE